MTLVAQGDTTKAEVPLKTTTDGKLWVALMGSGTATPHQLVVNPTGSIDVALQDQTTPVIFLDFMIQSGTFELTQDTVPGEYTMQVVTPHTMISGTMFEIFNTESDWLQGHVIGTSGASSGTVIIDQPFDRIYHSGTVSTSAYYGSHQLNVNGSVTPVVARVTNKDINIEWDITQLDAYIQDGTDMDNAMFGGLGDPLTRGVLFRANSNGIFKNGFVAKTNGDFVMVANNYAYNDRAPSGSFSLSINCCTFSMVGSSRPCPLLSAPMLTKSGFAIRNQSENISTSVTFPPILTTFLILYLL